MHRDRHIRPDEPDELDPLRRVHGDHEQGGARRRDRGAAQVHEHKVDVRVALGDLGQLGHEEGVAGDVDAEARVEGGGGGGGRGGRGEVAEFEEPAVCGGDLGEVGQVGGVCFAWFIIADDEERGNLQEREKKGRRLTAPNKSFIFPATPPGPGGTCFPGMPVTLIAALDSLPAISTRHSSKKSRSCTAVKASLLEADARCDLACGVVMMGRSVGIFEEKGKGLVGGGF